MYGYKRSTEEEMMRVKNLLDVLPQVDEKPKGHIIVNQGKNKITFSLREYEVNGQGVRTAKSTYLGETNSKKVFTAKRQLYLYELRRRLKKNLRVLERTVKAFQSYDDETLNNLFPPALRNIPLSYDTEERRGSSNSELWSDAIYQSAKKESCKLHYSLSGKAFRSKSEVIIANTFDSYNIEYRYEQRLELVNLKRAIEIRYPDFTILTRKGKIIYWEHLGLLHDEHYAQLTGEKLQLYSLNGIRPGKNLILSSDTAEGEIDAAEIVQLINGMLLD